MVSPRLRSTLLGLAACGALASASAAASPVLDPLAGPVHVGSETTLTGSEITPGSVLKVFVATAGGPVDVSSGAGLAPTSTTPSSFTVTLPFPWPVADPGTQFTVGNGFVSLKLVRTDMGFDGTNLVGAVLLGDDALGDDLIGNVWEWVHDWYDASYYSVSPSTDPPGPASTITGLRTMRGDAWDDSHSTFLRGAARLYNFPFLWNHSIGFRCARDD